MLVNLFDRRHVGLIVLLLTISLKNMSFTSQNKLCKLCIPASNLRHALMSGVFSVLFKKRCQSVLCVISESFLFVCLFWFIPFLESRFQHWQYHGVSGVSFLAEKAENIKYAFPGYLTAPRSFYFRQQFSELNKHYTAYRITCCPKPITWSCRCEFPQGRKFPLKWKMSTEKKISV